MTRLFSLMILLMVAGHSFAFEFPEVKDPWLRAAPPNVKMMAAYMQVINTSDSEKKLIGAYSPAFGMTELHKSIEENGQYRMEHQPELLLPPGGTLSFQPGGLHIMLMMPESALAVGDSVQICLIYQDDAGDKHIQHLDFPIKTDQN